MVGDGYSSAMRELLLWCLLCIVILVGCQTRVAGQIPIADTSTFSAPTLSGNETSKDLKKIRAETKASYAAVISALTAQINETETAEVQTSLNWLTGFAVLGFLAAFVAMWVIGFNKWDIGLALGCGGSIFVLQGLSVVAPWRYHIGAVLLIIGLVGVGVWVLRCLDWKRFKAAVRKDGFQLADLSQL